MSSSKKTGNLFFCRRFKFVVSFRRHLYIDMEKICRVWEIELQAVLEINKIGHRKRILYSLIGQRIEPPNIEEINEDACSNNALDLELSDNNNSSPPKPVSSAKPTTLSRHKKNRPAPQPPTNTTNLEIRAPAELLLTNQGSLQAQWKHSAAALVSGSIKYEVFVSSATPSDDDIWDHRANLFHFQYLGSTVIKELRGTESTRKSIQKLKKGDRVTSSSSPNHTSLIHSSRRPVCLAISHNGVQFIDIESQGVICEHSVKNIDCACQDAEDLSHFAYITKDFVNNIHYCHVFNVDSMVSWLIDGFSGACGWLDSLLILGSCNWNNSHTGSGFRSRLSTSITWNLIDTKQPGHGQTTNVAGEHYLNIRPRISINIHRYSYAVSLILKQRRAVHLIAEFLLQTLQDFRTLHDGVFFCGTKTNILMTWAQPTFLNVYKKNCKFTISRRVWQQKKRFRMT